MQLYDEQTKDTINGKVLSDFFPEKSHGMYDRYVHLAKPLIESRVVLLPLSSLQLNSAGREGFLVSHLDSQVLYES